MRAIAVVPVVLYHFGVQPFSGGYVGVDVFFVISGYLITSLIHGEMQDGRFSIVNFYERRIRRIFPALSAMLAVTAIASLIALFPNALIAFGKSLLATAGFVSNFQFWSEAGYFDAAASQKPLLHTWSLAVEEQFYCFFRGCCFCCAARSKAPADDPRRYIARVLRARHLGHSASPVSTFYLLPARFWELMLGSILAVGAFATPHGVRNAMSGLGLVLIGIAVFTFSAATPYPGENALLPCLGTAFVISRRRRRPRRRQQTVGQSCARADRVDVLFALSLALAGVCHREGLCAGRARHNRDRFAHRFVCGVGRIVVALYRATVSWPFGNTIAQSAVRGGGDRHFAPGGSRHDHVDTKGLPQRYDAQVQTILAEADDSEPRVKRCLGVSIADVAAGHLCKIGDQAAQPSFILWGDSHADSMMPALDLAARDKGRAGLFAGNGSCPPLMGVDQTEAPRCKAFNDAVLELGTSNAITEVFLHCRWAEYAATEPFIAEDRPIALRDGSTPDNNLAVLARGLTRTLQMLTAAHKKVVIIASVPEFREAVPEALARIALSGSHRDIRPTRAAYLARQKAVFDVFRQLQSKFPITVVYPHEILCASGTCEAERGGRPLYRDFHHLSVWGADQLVPLIEPAP